MVYVLPVNKERKLLYYRNGVIMKSRFEKGMLASIVGVILNLSLAILKMILGKLAYSQAVFADGINNLADSMSSIITLVGFKVSAKPADEDHPYGHERYEYIAGFVVAIIMLVLGFQTLKESVMGIFETSNLIFTPVTAFALFISILLKFFMFLYYRKVGKAIDSDVLFANAQDSMNDVMMTSAIFIGIGIEAATGYRLDGYIGIGVSMMILIQALGMIRTFINELLGRRPNKELLSNIKHDLDNNDEIFGYHDLLIHQYGSQKTYASVHIELDDRLSLVQAHTIIDDIESKVAQNYNIELVTHLDPLDLWSQEMQTIHKIIKTNLLATHAEASFHDLRIIHGVITLDIVIREEAFQKTIQTNIEKALKEENIMYPLKITFDTGQLI